MCHFPCCLGNQPRLSREHFSRLFPGLMMKQPCVRRFHGKVWSWTVGWKKKIEINPLNKNASPSQLIVIRIIIIDRAQLLNCENTEIVVNPNVIVKTIRTCWRERERIRENHRNLWRLEAIIIGYYVTSTWCVQCTLSHIYTFTCCDSGNLSFWWIDRAIDRRLKKEIIRYEIIIVIIMIYLYGRDESVWLSDEKQFLTPTRNLFVYDCTVVEPDQDRRPMAVASWTFFCLNHV
jgi:hypothetical protein